MGDREKVARIQKGEAERKESSQAGVGSFRADSPNLGFIDSLGQILPSSGAALCILGYSAAPLTSPH